MFYALSLHPIIYIYNEDSESSWYREHGLKTMANILILVNGKNTERWVFSYIYCKSINSDNLSEVKVWPNFAKFLLVPLKV